MIIVSGGQTNMSVSLLEVLEDAGYDLNTYEDANWFVSKQQEFNDLLCKAEDIVNLEEEIRLEKELYQDD